MTTPFPAVAATPRRAVPQHDAPSATASPAEAAGRTGNRSQVATLEQQLDEIVTKHGLTGLSIHASDGRFYAFAHRGPGLCGLSEHHATAAEAIGQAIGKCPTNLPAPDLAPLAPIEGLAA